MIKIILTTIVIFTFNFSYGQNLYPVKFESCKLSRFCLDCGEPKAELPENGLQFLINNLNPKASKKINGAITLQILVDTLGNSCLISAENKTNISVKKLDIENAVNSMPTWKPASKKGKLSNSSISIELIFKDGKVSFRRLEFDFSKNTNFKSVGTSEIKGSKEKNLTEDWIVFNQSNSGIPWDMSRSIAVDNANNVWVSTDNGLVKITDGNFKVFNSDNSPIISKRGKSFTTHLTIDANDNIWFSDGYNGYKFGQNNWTVFDTINSPLRWTIGIQPDNEGNVYFRTFEGLRKYDGKQWTIIDQSNTDLPMERISGFFIDSKNRTWIGTYEGNIRIENGETTNFENSDSPLLKASISKIFEDSKENLWFGLYSENKENAGMWLLKSNGEWQSIRPKNSELFTENDINDFLLDEETNILWIALNSVGLIRYDITNDKWETYTPANSNIPSIHVMKLIKDKKGIIWGATFAGIIKLKSK
jgi:hypothetical protein